MRSASLTVLITALKKTVAFQDDLVKKLAGISLIQRAINKAVDLGVDKSSIYLLTDSEEILLIAERNSVQAFCDPKLIWSDVDYANNLGEYLKEVSQKNDYTLLLSPYAPLLNINLINEAFDVLIRSGKELLKPVKHIKRHLHDDIEQPLYLALFGSEQELLTIESKAFSIFRSDILKNKSNKEPSVYPWHIEHDVIEIESYQDWWVCEKLLNRKRIVFRVIGNEKVGMGHLYRALSLAHDITDHEILFVSDDENTVAVNKLAGYDYWLGIYDSGKVLDNIIKLKPDLVINDILSTSKSDVQRLQKQGIKVINFEDLGDGAMLADLTINELYDMPQFEGRNVHWGHNYFFVRDEFIDAKSHVFSPRIDTILLTFGGTDQHDLTRTIYNAIKDICKLRKIKLHIVTGSGYQKYNLLEEEIKSESNITLTKATGVISSIMEQSQIAIVSNGRTLYELAHMNIPAIVISQHSRENSHSFSCEENGFVSLGLFKKGETEVEVVKQLTKLLDDNVFRKRLFERITKFRFDENKNNVLRLILELLPKQVKVN